MRLRNGFVLISVLLFCNLTSKSQVIMSLIFGDKLNSKELLFGIHINGSINYFTGTPVQKTLESLNAGLFFTYRFNEHLHANVEMLAKYTRGADGLPPYDLGNPDLNAQFAAGAVKRKIQYLSVPLSIRYLFDERFFVELGPQVSLRTKSIDIFSTGIEEGELSIERETKDDIQRWDFAWLAGVGYMFGKTKLFAIGIRYTGGFIDASLIDEGRQAHQQWGVYSNIPIGRGKMQKREEEKKRKAEASKE